MGYRRDIAQIMRAADLFVFPSRYEACTLVLLEALSFRTSRNYRNRNRRRRNGDTRMWGGITRLR